MGSTTSDFYNTHIQYDEWQVVDDVEVLKKKELTIQLVTHTGVYLNALGGYMAHRLDEHDPAMNRVDFNLQQAYKMVIMTVADEASLPTTGIAVGQPCWCTSEKTLHICTSAS